MNLLLPCLLHVAICHASYVRLPALPNYLINPFLLPYLHLPLEHHYIIFSQCYPTKIYIFTIFMGLAMLILPPFLAHIALNAFIVKLDTPDTCKQNMLMVYSRGKPVPIAIANFRTFAPRWVPALWSPQHSIQLSTFISSSSFTIISSFTNISIWHGVDLPKFDYPWPLSDNDIELEVH